MMLISATVTADDLAKANDYLPFITYIAGYCVYSVTKKLKCDKCKKLLISPGENVENLSNALIQGVSKVTYHYITEIHYNNNCISTGNNAYIYCRKIYLYKFLFQMW